MNKTYKLDRDNSKYQKDLDLLDLQNKKKMEKKLGYEMTTEQWRQSKLLRNIRRPKN